MKPINYQLSNTILNKIVEAEVLRSEIMHVDLDARGMGAVEGEQVVNGIFHMAHMMGMDMSLGDAERFVRGRVGEFGEADHGVLRNFKNCIEYIRSNKNNNYIDINTTFLLHLNKIMLDGWRDEWEARFRDSSDIDPTYESWIYMMDETINPLEVSSELTTAIDWYKNNITRVHPLIRVSVFIFTMIRILPFAFANKLTIVAAVDFLLQKNGYSNNGYLSIARIFDKNDFASAWSQAVSSQSGNITIWIEEFVTALVGEYEQTLALTKKQKTKEEESGQKPFLNLNKRQLKILRYLQNIPGVKREDYVQMFDVSTMTAFRDLNSLVRKKLLRTDGRGRATRYMLSHR